jgi:hypothetical protein
MVYHLVLQGDKIRRGAEPECCDTEIYNLEKSDDESDDGELIMQSVTI